MTVILVVASFIAIATLRWYLQTRTERLAESARALGSISLGMDLQPGQPPRQFHFHPGHTWIHLHENGLASIGVSEFAANFAGSLSRVELPIEGRRLRKGDSAWTLVSGGKRRLEQSMPIAGKVVAVNQALLEKPDLVHRSPYEEGWVLRIQPKRQILSTDFISTAEVKAWFEAARDTITARLSPALGTLAQDGGEWFAVFGDQLDDDEWQQLKRDLFPAQKPVIM